MLNTVGVSMIKEKTTIKLLSEGGDIKDSKWAAIINRMAKEMNKEVDWGLAEITNKTHIINKYKGNRVELESFDLEIKFK